MVQMQPKPGEEVVTARQFLLRWKYARGRYRFWMQSSRWEHISEDSSWGNIGKGLGVGRQTFSNLAHFIPLKKTMEFANAFLNEHHGHHIMVTTPRSPHHGHHVTVTTSRSPHHGHHEYHGHHFTVTTPRFTKEHSFRSTPSSLAGANEVTRHPCSMLCNTYLWASVRYVGYAYVRYVEYAGVAKPLFTLNPMVKPKSLTIFWSSTLGAIAAYG